MLLQLHAIKGKNKYCGPSAVASILGLSTDHAAREIRAFSGQRAVKGVRPAHLQAALVKLGAEVRYTPLRESYSSLAQWLRDNQFRFAASHLVLQFGVVADSHYATISGGMYQCNHSLQPVPFEFIPFRPVDGFVFGVFEVLTRPVAAPCDRHRVERNQLQKAKRIAAKFGIVIERYAGRFEVACPELEHDDPLEGCNETQDVQVVLELVERYRQCLEGGYLEAVTDPRFL